MAYFVTGLSFTPKYCPSFETINEDGSPFRFQKSPAGRTLGLEGGFRLTENTDPPLSWQPRFARLRSAHKNLPDIFNAGGGMCINQEMREAIESREPNVHQFLPIILLRKNGERFENRYYQLNICQVLDSIIFEKSSLKWLDSPACKHATSTGGQTAPYEHRTLKKDKIQGKHLWREKKYLPDFYISDELHRLFEKSKFKGIETHRCIRAIEE